MKPAPFVRHVPQHARRGACRSGEGRAAGWPRARRRAEPRADHGVSSGQARASRRHQRGRGARPHRRRRQGFVDRRARAPRGLSQSRSRPARSARCSATSCATSRITRSACAARSAAASPMPIRHRNGASPRRRSMRRWSRKACAANGRSLPGIFSPASCRRRWPKTNCSPKFACRCWRPTRNSASTNSTGAPAISPWPRRSSLIGSKSGKMSEPHVGVGGAEPNPRRIAEAEAALERQDAGRCRLPRRRGGCGRRDRPAGGSSDHGRIPARPGARGGAPRAGAARMTVMTAPQRRPKAPERPGSAAPSAGSRTRRWSRDMAASPPTLPRRAGCASCAARSPPGASTRSRRRTGRW